MDIAKSDKKIKRALEILQGSERGKIAIGDLFVFFNKNQAGLDMLGADAVTCLVEEFFLNHRRGFIN